ncbi:MAG: SIR2 family protein [Collinsella sp.]
MYVNNIQIPGALNQALLKHELVIFAGSGVSMQGDCPLPDFRGLVKQIAEVVARPGSTNIDELLEESCETALGHLDQVGNIHQACARAIGKGLEGYSDLHVGILRLFGNKRKVRVVTTNFDRRFEGAAESLGISPQTYIGPALPLGDDFEGVVYLHGNVLFPEQTVLTDVDFGKAYITNAWASRFLLDMFTRYTVLFVGYSCSDMMVKYLTRSISADMNGRIFALERGTSRDDEWSSLGVIPVHFNNFNDLAPLFKGWEKLSNESLSVRRSAVASYAEISSQLSYMEQENLASFFTNPEDGDEERYALATAFCTNANSIEALKNLVDCGLDSFLTKDELDSWEWTFLDWSVESFSVNKYADVYQIVVSKGQALSSLYVCESIRHIADSPDSTDACISFWLSFLNPEETDELWMEFTFPKLLSKIESSELALRLIDIMLSYKAEWSKGFAGTKGSFHPRFTFNYSDNVETVSKAIVGWADCIGERLLSLLCNRLSAIANLEAGYTELSEWIDSSSYIRHAIEDHEQDMPKEGTFCVLIDCAREIGRKLFLANKLELNQVFTLIGSKCSLVKRLGLYLYCLKLDDADQALMLVVKCGAFKDPAAKYELYHLVLNAYPKASRLTREKFIEGANLTFSNYGDAHHCSYARFNLYQWLVDNNVTDDLLQQQLNQNRVDYHDFKLTDLPDLSSYTTCGFPQITPLAASKFTADNVIQLFDGAVDDDYDHFEAAEIVRVSCNANPNSVIDVISDIANKIESEPEMFAAKYMLLSIPWDSVDSDKLDQLLPVFNITATYHESYAATIHALECLVRKIDNAHVAECIEHTISLVAPERLLTSASDQGISNSVKVDWFSRALNSSLGQAVNAQIFLLSRCDELELNDGSASLLGSIEQLIKASCNDEASSNIIFAALFSQLNYWAANHMPFYKECMEPVVLNSDTFGHIGSIWGLSNLNIANRQTWHSLSDVWHKFAVIPCKELNKPYERIRKYCLFSSIRFDEKESRSKLLSYIGRTPALVSDVVSAIVHFLNNLDPADALEAWNGWAKDDLFNLIDSEQNFEQGAPLLRRMMTLNEDIASACIVFMAQRCEWKLGPAILTVKQLKSIITCSNASEADVFIVILMQLKWSRLLQVVQQSCVDYINSKVEAGGLEEDLIDMAKDVYAYKSISVPQTPNWQTARGD